VGQVRDLPLPQIIEKMLLIFTCLDAEGGLKLQETFFEDGKWTCQVLKTSHTDFPVGLPKPLSWQVLSC
jgi:hypothetical protein